MITSSGVIVMPLTCNIDARGKMFRLIVGTVFAIDGVVMLLVWALREASRARWMFVASIVLVAVGSFMIFEGRKGWCALRAMGMKTPM
jgi:hypothetical protein